MSLLEPLTAAVKANCHIADARFAGDYTMCVYLLKMRELYRWEQRLPFTAVLPKQAVGEWLSKREQLWHEIAEDEYHPIVIDNQSYDPFDTERINQCLAPHDLVYSGGLGHKSRPHFFLGRRYKQLVRDEYQILISAEEYARDLSAPPAMLLDHTIFIRRESLRRMLWERVEEWNWKKFEGPMSRALDAYDFESNVESSLDELTENEMESILLHELGELKAGEILGEHWNEMLASVPHTVAEIMARAVRDHLADCLSTLPNLIGSYRLSSLHFYFGNYRAMRREIYPRLFHAYNVFADHGTDLGPLEDEINQGRAHWQRIAEHMLNLYRRHGDACAPHIENLVNTNKL